MTNIVVTSCWELWLSESSIVPGQGFDFIVLLVPLIGAIIGVTLAVKAFRNISN